MSPTERTLRWLRTQGWTCDVVERRIARSFVTKDLFGCIDVVAVHPEKRGVLGVQTTTTPHLADRVKKVKAEARSELWLSVAGPLWVVGWAKRGDRGKRKLWMPTVVELSEIADEAAG